MSRNQITSGLTALSLNPSNRGLAYGDGLFETMRCIDREVPLWGYHKERLLQSLERLQIKLDEPALEAELNDVLQQLPQRGSSVIKLIVTRGDSGRGYRVDPQSSSLCVWQTMAAPECYSAPLKLGICQTRLARQPLLAGMKHLNRLEQVMARLEWNNEYDDALMLDSANKVVEATAANIFLLQSDRLITPCLEHSGVAGVMRTYLRQHIFPRFELEVEERPLELDEIYASEGLWLCSSVRGIAETASLVDHQWSPSELFARVRDSLYGSLHPRWAS